jgi:hypothetical protein
LNAWSHAQTDACDAESLARRSSLKNVHRTKSKKVFVRDLRQVAKIRDPPSGPGLDPRVFPDSLIPPHHFIRGWLALTPPLQDHLGKRVWKIKIRIIPIATRKCCLPFHENFRPRVISENLPADGLHNRPVIGQVSRLRRPASLGKNQALECLGLAVAHKLEAQPLPRRCRSGNAAKGRKNPHMIPPQKVIPGPFLPKY